MSAMLGVGLNPDDIDDILLLFLDDRAELYDDDTLDKSYLGLDISLFE